MCGGVFFMHKGEEYRYYFPNPKAVLPVKMKDGEAQLLPWGAAQKADGQSTQWRLGEAGLDLCWQMGSLCTYIRQTNCVTVYGKRYRGQ